MKTILERFTEHLTDITYPNNKKEGWHVEGMLKQFSNKKYKFDVRDMVSGTDGTAQKGGSFKTKAEKFVFETNEQWLIFDIEEFLDYLNEHKVKVIRLEEMMNKLFFVWEIKK